MERIGLGFKILRENLWLWLVAIGFNMMLYVLNLVCNNLPLVPPGIHLKFAMPNNIPEMSGILQQPQTQGININFSLLSLVIAPLLAGGFLAGIFKIIKGETMTKEIFGQDCKYFFIRLLGVNILTFLFMLAALLPAFLFPPLAIISLIFVMYYTYFWQLALVKEDLQIMEAFHRGHTIFKDNLSRVIGLLFPIAILSAFIGVPLNILAQEPLGYLLAIILWTFSGSILAIAVISLFADLQKDPDLLAPVD
ncbi:MAG: hypothetical protein ACOWWO_13810 [Peptococcaceae bacterium]